MAMMIQPMVSSMIAGGDDDLADIAAHEAHLAHHHRDDLDRGDRQRGAEEQRGDEALLADRGSSASGSNWPSAKPQANGMAMPATETLNAARPTLAHQREIGLHAGEQQQQQDAELRDAVDHRLLLGAVGKDRCCASGQSAPNTDGPSRMPASSCRSPAGWPIRCMISPSTAADGDQQRRSARSAGIRTDARRPDPLHGRAPPKPTASAPPRSRIGSAFAPAFLAQVCQAPVFQAPVFQAPYRLLFPSGESEEPNLRPTNAFPHCRGSGVAGQSDRLRGFTQMPPRCSRPVWLCNGPEIHRGCGRSSEQEGC